MSCKNCTCKSKQLAVSKKIDGYAKKTKPTQDERLANLGLDHLGLPKTSAVSNLDRATSVWKCPLCDKTVVGISFKYLDQQSSPICPVCDTDMRLNGVTIDGVTQTVK